MKNPLYKRIPREIKHDLGKYIALFLFLCITIGFCSGFLVAGSSLKTTYDESFEKYNIEDGHFATAQKADTKLLNEVEKDEKCTIYNLNYKNINLGNEHTVRFFKARDKVNRVDILDGHMPEKNGEVVIDRLYAENNGIKINDTFKADGKNFKVTGFVALSDYSALFKNNTDMMFNANKFTVAILTDEDYSSIDNAGLNYCYCWTNNDRNLSDVDRQKKSDSIKDALAEKFILTDFVARQNNQAINFTGDDMGGDKAMVTWLLYIVIVVMSFVFAVTSRNTMEKEASVIGTLRASGYTRGEVLRHYLVSPLLVTFIAAVIGNILGYSFMKDFVASIYYQSYSLTTFHTVWNAEAFIKTTVVPCIIIIVINVIVLTSMLKLSPLQFLRHDLKKNKKKRAIALPNWKFLIRFRIRIILQNKSTYLTLFVGILFATVLLMFGMMFSPLLDNFKDEVINSQIATYQYVLKAPLETQTPNAEKYSLTGLENDNEEEISVYGISDKSKYLSKLTLPKNKGEVVLSDGYMEKYGISDGDKIKLKDKYKNKSYTFTVKGSYHYSASLCVFMPIDKLNETFDLDSGYFTGYFSDKAIKDIDKDYIATIITQGDLTVMADQLDDSMGMIFPMFGGFAIVIYVLIIYLLAKIIIEKNASSISMIKILGYSNGEASRLYNFATAIVVVLALVISISVCSWAIKEIYYAMMLEYSGWLTYYIAPWIYPAILAIGIACYVVVHFIQTKRIRKIPMSQGLKDME